MVGSFFRPDQQPEQLIAGLLPRRKDRDQMAYKAFLLGRQLASLEKERMQFYKEQAQSAQQMNQMLLMLMNLQAQQKPPVNLPPVPGGGMSGPLTGTPMPGMPSGPEGAAGMPTGGPLPGEVPLPMPGGGAAPGSGLPF